MDNKQEVLTNLRKTLKVVDELNDNTEWPLLEKKLKTDFYRLETVQKELGNETSQKTVDQLRIQLETILEKKDIKLGNMLYEEINTTYVQLTLIYQLIGFIQYCNSSFNTLTWKDSNQARSLINQGLEKIENNSTVEVLHPITIALIQLLPDDQKPIEGDDGSRLKGGFPF